MPSMASPSITVAMGPTGAVSAASTSTTERRFLKPARLRAQPNTR